MKYEEVYLRAYTNGREAKDGLETYLHVYNTQRPHQALGYRTPAEVFNGDAVELTEQTAENKCPAGAMISYTGTPEPSAILSI